MDAAVLDGPTDPISTGSPEVKGKSPVKRRAKTKAPVKRGPTRRLNREASVKKNDPKQKGL